MDLNELNMLDVIRQCDYISQREISNKVGISLGMVNLLLKKFIKVGIIKAEKLTGNKVKYILTPEGITFLSKKTIDFVSRSYQAVLKIQNHMMQMIEEEYDFDETVVILGIQDEIGEMLIDILRKRGNPYIWISESGNHHKYVQWQDPQEEGIYLLRGQ